jgi:hypothetical protein
MFVFLVWILRRAIIIFLVTSAVTKGDESIVDNTQLLYVSSTLLLITGTLGKRKTSSTKAPSTPHCKRQHKLVNDIYAELGTGYMHRAYQMDEASFWKLYSLLKSHLKDVLAQHPKSQMARKRRKERATVISKSIQERARNMANRMVPSMGSSHCPCV